MNIRRRTQVRIHIVQANSPAISHERPRSRIQLAPDGIYATRQSACRRSHDWRQGNPIRVSIRRCGQRNRRMARGQARSVWLQFGWRVPWRAGTGQIRLGGRPRRGSADRDRGNSGMVAKRARTQRGNGYSRSMFRGIQYRLSDFGPYFGNAEVGE